MSYTPLVRMDAGFYTFDISHDVLMAYTSSNYAAQRCSTPHATSGGMVRSRSITRQMDEPSTKEHLSKDVFVQYSASPLCCWAVVTAVYGAMCDRLFGVNAVCLTRPSSSCRIDAACSLI